MPTLLDLNNYRFFFYSNEGNLLKFPNVFVHKDGSEAEFVISQDEIPTILLKRSSGFSAEELAELKHLIETSGSLIREDWNNAFC